MKVKKQEWFKETKNKKGKDIKPMELAKTALVVAGSVAVVGLGLSLLD